MLWKNHFFPSIALLFLCMQLRAQQAIKFIQNKNQWDNTIKYRAELKGGYIFVKDNSLQYSFYDAQAVAQAHEDMHTTNPASRVNYGIRSHSFEVKFLQSNISNDFEEKNPVPEKYNYFLGNDATRWGKNAAGFEEVTYQNIYKGIDLKLYTQAGNFKYEFVVAPQVNPSIIKMQYTHTEGLSLDAEGNLIIQTSINKVVEKKPYCYQTIHGKKITVKSSFVLNNNELSFELEKFDPNYPLIIDPELVFSTYSGSTSDNYGYTATFDEEGHLYAGGVTFGANFPITLGAFQITYGGGQKDISIQKYNTSYADKTLVYATFMGGNGEENPHSLIVNSNNELIVFGSVSSKDFPITANAFDKTYNGGNYDLFLAKISSEGETLIASTYLGGNSNDGYVLKGLETKLKNYGDTYRGEVILDENGFIYIASISNSTNFPTKNAFQNKLSAGFDGVVTKLNPDLTDIVWSSYIGGNKFDAAFSIKLNSKDEIYIGGATTSTNLATSPDALVPASMGSDDGFLAQIKPDGSLGKITYLGTASPEQVYLIDIDAEDNVYAFGQIQGSYPVSQGVYQNPNSGQFIHKLNPTLTTSLLSTVIGAQDGTPDISPTAFMLSDCGNIYLAGWGSNLGGTLSTNGLSATPDAFQPTTFGNDFYLMILEKDFKSLLYATFIGGQGNEHVDGGTSRFDKRGIVYHSACIGDDAFPTTANAWAKKRGMQDYGYNNVAFKFDLDALTANFKILDPITLQEISEVCVPQEVILKYEGVGAKQIAWELDGQPLAQGINQTSYVFTKKGDFEFSLKASNLATCKKLQVLKRPLKAKKAEFDVPSAQRICIGQAVKLQANGAINYKWSPAEGLSDPNIADPIANPAKTTTYTLSMVGAEGCQADSTVRVEIVPQIKMDFEVQVVPDCSRMPAVKFINKVENADEFWWIMGNGDTLKEKTPEPYVYKESGHYEITLIASNGACSEIQTQEVTIENNPSAPANLITPNGDGHNELFILPYANYKLEIFNRWGNSIYKSNNYQNDWGRSAENALYYYVITSPNGDNCNGWLQVLR